MNEGKVKFLDASASVFGQPTVYLPVGTTVHIVPEGGGSFLEVASDENGLSSRHYQTQQYPVSKDKT